jgi:hypothetical protein
MLAVAFMQILLIGVDRNVAFETTRFIRGNSAQNTSKPKNILYEFA